MYRQKTNKKYFLLKSNKICSFSAPLYIYTLDYDVVMGGKCHVTVI